MREISTVYLSEEGLEALYLADMKEMDQKKAADKMQVSRSTFSRMVNEARKTVAQALVDGAAIQIGGQDNK